MNLYRHISPSYRTALTAVVIVGIGERLLEQLSLDLLLSFGLSREMASPSQGYQETAEGS